MAEIEIAKMQISQVGINQVEMFPDLPKNDTTLTADGMAKIPTALDVQHVASSVPDKTVKAFKTISEVSVIIAVPQYVLRFWETKFKQIKPLKMRGGRRYYRPEDIEVLQTIKHLLYKEGYTIKGARKALMDIKKNKAAEKAARKKAKKPAPLLQPQHPSDASIASKQEAEQKAKKRRELAAIQAELLALKEELVLA